MRSGQILSAPRYIFVDYLQITKQMKLQNIIIRILGLLIFTVSLLPQTKLKAQEFSFKLFIEDAIGNTDSVVFGYDVNATDTIDMDFGEIDIKQIPFNSILDVRLANAFFEDCNCIFTGHHIEDPTAFHTKTQINKFELCEKLFTTARNTILLKAIHYPVTIRWDKTLFGDTCVSHSVLNPMNFKNWFDIGYEYTNGLPPACFNIFFKDYEQVELTDFIYYADTICKPPEYYIDNNQDTIRLLYFSFSSQHSMSVGVDEPNTEDVGIVIFPNPSSGKVKIEISQFISIKNPKLHIYDVYGNSVYFHTLLNEKNTIDISNLPSGSYYLIIEYETNKYNKIIFIN